jgi:hypothetical protein
MILRDGTMFSQGRTKQTSDSSPRRVAKRGRGMISLAGLLGGLSCWGGMLSSGLGGLQMPEACLPMFQKSHLPERKQKLEA